MVVTRKETKSWQSKLDWDQGDPGDYSWTRGLSMGPIRCLGFSRLFPTPPFGLAPIYATALALEPAHRCRLGTLDARPLAMATDLVMHHASRTKM